MFYYINPMQNYDFSFEQLQLSHAFLSFLSNLQHTGITTYQQTLGSSELVKMNKPLSLKILIFSVIYLFSSPEMLDIIKTRNCFSSYPFGICAGKKIVPRGFTY